jgi:phospholipid N-methyltransferase
VFSDAVTFFREFVRHPRQLGSVIPSSRFLKRRIVETANVADARLIVELGPGNGGTTLAILAAMGAESTLLSIELNQGLFELARRIGDERYIAHHGDARALADILATYNLSRPDVVISGIPFSTMDAGIGTAILQSIHQQLAPGGRFVAYQVSGQVDRLNTFYRADQRTRQTEWLNIPPLRVWCWTRS